MVNQKQSFIQPAERIASFKPYFFASLASKLNSLREKKVDVIRIDMGSPDLPPADFIIDALEKSARKPDHHGYTPNGGTPAFKKAVSTYYENRFEVELDPAKEILALIGSKEGIFNLSQVLLNPGDSVLIPDPGYPVYSASAMISGAQIIPVPLHEEDGFIPDLDAIPEEQARAAKMMWLNYPNNPTGAVAPYSFFEKAVLFAKKYQIVLAHDAPYTDVCFDGYVAPSLMQVPGAKDVAIEFNSLSKSYNMAGWRLGMAVGNPQIIQYLHTYKSQMDSAIFAPILDAGIAALTGDQSWIEGRNKTYQERRDIVLKGLREAGFKVSTPPAAIYVWARLPAAFTDSIEFCDRLLSDTGVSMTPGNVYGKFGEGYIRISLGTDTKRIEEAMQRVIAWVKEKA
jgi:LL-diaminopimelate aminotransferase